jgi:N-acetylneuraminate synthase
MTLDVRGGSFEINDPDSLWAGQNLHDLYKKAYTPWEWHAPIMQRARELGLICFSSPFDETAVDFLEDLGAPAYKIASFENNHLPLIAKAASIGMPLIISTGMATLSELDDAVKTAREAGCKQLVLLKCTSNYPSSPENTNLRMITHLRQLFATEVGLSDHTMGIGAAVAAIALGASVVDKHFTLARADGGVDSAFSLEPSELSALVLETERAWQALGEVRYGPTESEQPSMRFRRSIYIVQDMKAGEVITREKLRVIRPGYGLAPKHYDSLLGRRVNRDLAIGNAMKWDYILSVFEQKVSLSKPNFNSIDHLTIRGKPCV